MTPDMLYAVGGLGIGSLISGFVTHFFLRRKYKAEAGKTTSDSAIDYINLLQDRLIKVEQAMDDLRKDNIEMHKQIATLETEKVQLLGRIEYLETELSKYRVS